MAIRRAPNLAEFSLVGSSLCRFNSGWVRPLIPFSWYDTRVRGERDIGSRGIGNYSN